MYKNEKKVTEYIMTQELNMSGYALINCRKAAAACGTNDKSFRRVVKKLEKQGWITTKTHYDENGKVSGKEIYYTDRKYNCSENPMRKDKTNEKPIGITITIKYTTREPDAKREAALRTFWRLKKKAAKRAMDLCPVGSDEREIYRAKYNEAKKQYNSLLRRYTKDADKNWKRAY